MEQMIKVETLQAKVIASSSSMFSMDFLSFSMAILSLFLF